MYKMFVYKLYRNTFKSILESSDQMQHLHLHALNTECILLLYQNICFTGTHVSVFHCHSRRGEIDEGLL